MSDIFHSLSDFYAADKAASTPTTDAAPTMTEADPFADLRAAVTQDADWREDAHPRESKGGEGGGRFAKKPETLQREDNRDLLEKDPMSQESLDRLKDRLKNEYGFKNVRVMLDYGQPYIEGNLGYKVKYDDLDDYEGNLRDLLEDFLESENLDGSIEGGIYEDHLLGEDGTFYFYFDQKKGKAEYNNTAKKAMDSYFDAFLHPRAAAGSSHGGEFTIKPETISREDSHDAPAAIGASLERGLTDIVKAAGPHGTSAKADVFREFGKPVAAIRIVKNDRERFSAAEMKAMIDALQRAGCSDVEEVRDSDRPHETAIFCTPPIDPGEAAAEYMAEVEKSVGGSKGGGSYTPSDEAKESAAAMAKNKDEKNPAKRIKVDFQEWTLESAQREEPSATGTEEDETDGKVFDSPESAAKWLLDTKNAGALEGDDAWYSSVSGKDGKWKTYRLTPVNFTEQEILDIEKIVSKGKKED